MGRRSRWEVELVSMALLIYAFAEIWNHRRIFDRLSRATRAAEVRRNIMEVRMAVFRR